MANGDIMPIPEPPPIDPETNELGRTIYKEDWNIHMYQKLWRKKPKVGITSGLVNPLPKGPAETETHN